MEHGREPRAIPGHRAGAAIAALLAASWVATSCQGPSAKGALMAPSGRKVSAASDTGHVNLRHEANPDTIRVDLGTWQIVVEPRRLVVDGTDAATLSASEKLIEIRVLDGVVTVRAGGEQVFRKQKP